MERAVVMGKRRVESPCDRRDEALIRSVLAGDVKAYRSLYDTHMPRIYKFAYWNTKTEASAEEITQEVFVKAWEKLSQFGFKSAFSTWLFRIAINTLKSEYRRRGVENSRMQGTIDIEEASLEGSEEIDPAVLDLRRAIGSLPKRARQVLSLYEFEKKSHKEIAALLRISVGTSKAHLNRAKRLLREDLEA